MNNPILNADTVATLDRLTPPELLAVAARLRACADSLDGPHLVAVAEHLERLATARTWSPSTTEPGEPEHLDAWHRESVDMWHRVRSRIRQLVARAPLPSE